MECADCSVIISSNAKRCRKCSGLLHSKSMIGKSNSNYGNKWSQKDKDKQSSITKEAMKSPEVINKMIKNHTDVSGSNNPMFGVHRFGKESPCWIDGRSYEMYPVAWTEKFKEQIRTRDNHTCQNCGMTEEEHILVVGTVLHVHHIDYNKQNCKESNLITTCKSCNIKANKNRDYWEKFFTKKLRGNYVRQ